MQPSGVNAIGIRSECFSPVVAQGLGHNVFDLCRLQVRGSWPRALSSVSKSQNVLSIPTDVQRELDKCCFEPLVVRPSPYLVASSLNLPIYLRVPA